MTSQQAQEPFSVYVQIDTPDDLGPDPTSVVADHADEMIGRQQQAGYCSGHICAEGTASLPEKGKVLATNPTKIYAKIYRSRVDPPYAAHPPADAVTVTPTGSNWSFPALRGVNYSANSPYPDNTVVIWAEFDGGRFENSGARFKGKQAPKTDCEDKAKKV